MCKGFAWPLGPAAAESLSCDPLLFPTLLQIPVALALDLMLGRATFTKTPRALVLNMLSVVFVVAGFVGINLNEIAWLDQTFAWAVRKLRLSSGCSSPPRD